MKRNARAFTIMEVTISMLVTALVIGITYSAYLIISGAYISFFKKSSQLAQLNLFNQLLTKDISRARLVMKDSAGIKIFIDKQYLEYEFQPDCILRHAAFTDTFKFRSDSVTLSFEGHNLDLLSTDPERNRVDELFFKILLENQQIPYHYQKQYSSEELIKRSSDATH